MHISEGTKVGTDTNAQHVMVIMRMLTDVECLMLVHVGSQA